MPFTAAGDILMEQAERYLRASPQLRGKLQGSYEDLFFKNIVKIKNKDFFFLFFFWLNSLLPHWKTKLSTWIKKKKKTHANTCHIQNSINTRNICGQHRLTCPNHANALILMQLLITAATFPALFAAPRPARLIWWVSNSLDLCFLCCLSIWFPFNLPHSQ